MPEAVELFLTTVEDMYKRHNINSPMPPRLMIEKFYEHIYRTGIFQVAEVEGRIGAICHAIVRDSQWFLSGFWALPSLQGRKIGRTLLERVWQRGARAGAEIFFTWSSVDIQALAAYMKMGMLPGYQILTFAGEYQNQSDVPSGYESQPLEISNAMEIDEQVRGTRREIDHRFSLEEFKAEGRQVMRDGRAIGYYYFTGSQIGSAAWLDAKDAEGVLVYACRDASSQAAQIRFVALGVNHAAIRFALRVGLRLAAYSHLLTTAPFGQMEKYLPSGPSLF
jgi:GNAT superfamily N-acetyltransferase